VVVRRRQIRRLDYWVVGWVLLQFLRRKIINTVITSLLLHRAGDLVSGGRNGGCQNPSVLPQTLCKELGPDGSDVCLSSWVRVSQSIESRRLFFFFLFLTGKWWVKHLFFLSLLILLIDHLIIISSVAAILSSPSLLLMVGGVRRQGRWQHLLSGICWVVIDILWLVLVVPDERWVAVGGWVRGVGRRVERGGGKEGRGSWDRLKGSRREVLCWRWVFCWFAFGLYGLGGDGVARQLTHSFLQCLPFLLVSCQTR
jgi:hypothetical protein